MPMSKEANNSLLSESVVLTTSIAYTKKEVEKLKVEFSELIENSIPEPIIEVVEGPQGKVGRAGPVGPRGKKVEGKTNDDGWVHPDKEQLNISYNEAIPYHHEVIKNLLNRIEQLEKTIEELKSSK